MGLRIPSYPNKFDPANALQGAYAWITSLRLNFRTGSGDVTLDIHPTETAWSALPVSQITVQLGEVLSPPFTSIGDPPPHAPIVFPTLAELMADPEFAAAYNTIGSKLYTKLVELVPALQGSSQV